MLSTGAGDRAGHVRQPALGNLLCSCGKHHYAVLQKDTKDVSGVWYAIDGCQAAKALMSCQGPTRCCQHSAESEYWATDRGDWNAVGYSTEVWACWGRLR